MGDGTSPGRVVKVWQTLQQTDNEVVNEWLKTIQKVEKDSQNEDDNTFDKAPVASDKDLLSSIKKLQGRSPNRRKTAENSMFTAEESTRLHIPQTGSRGSRGSPNPQEKMQETSYDDLIRQADRFLLKEEKDPIYSSENPNLSSVKQRLVDKAFGRSPPPSNNATRDDATISSLEPIDTLTDEVTNSPKNASPIMWKSSKRVQQNAQSSARKKLPERTAEDKEKLKQSISVLKQSINELTTHSRVQTENLNRDINHYRQVSKHQKVHLEELKDLQRHLWKYSANERTISTLQQKLSKVKPRQQSTDNRGRGDTGALRGEIDQLKRRLQTSEKTNRALRKKLEKLY